MAHQSPPRRRYLQTRARAESRTQSQQTITKSTPGSWIKSKILPWIAPWFQPHRSYDPEDSFIPFPKVTFLVDKPIRIQCQICHQANCQIKPDAEPPGESEFSLMPCGHAACSNCLGKWFKNQKTCPFCRTNLAYGCGHAVPPRPLTEEGLHMIPKTLLDQGCIPNFCVHCRKAIQMEEAKDKFRQAVGEFEAARQRFSQTQATADELVMLSKRDAFETVYQDVHLNLLRTWLTRW